MTEIVLSYGNVSIFYSSVIIALGTASCFCLTWSLYRANHGKGSVLCLFLLLSTFLSVIFSRVLHWYCHSEQYESFIYAVTDYSAGGFVFIGVIIGIVVSYLIIVFLQEGEDNALILDCSAPGTAVLIILVRISSLFNSSCRSKITVRNPALQHMPLASKITDAAGNEEYRFATFFIEAIMLAVLLIGILLFFSKIRNTPSKNAKSSSGGVWLHFLVWYCAIEVVMDSTRYDSSFVPFNGFVSVVQSFCGIMMLAVLIYFSVRAIIADGLKIYHWIIWSVWFIALGGAGISEYLIQRHENWYLSCYSLMGACLIIMSILTVRMYRHQCDNISPSE